MYNLITSTCDDPRKRDKCPVYAHMKAFKI